MDVKHELDVNEQLLYKTSKNYQIWFDRQSLLEDYQNFENEIPLIERVLQGDSKNIHAWGHRYLSHLK